MALTTKQMAQLDDDLISMGISVTRMMEYAGLFPAQLADKYATKKYAACLVGSGNNGGDALVAARHLINWGYKVDVIFATPITKLKKIPLEQWKILQKMGVKRTTNPKWNKYGVILDGLLGYNIKGNPRGKFAALIGLANSSKAPIVAIDTPSGIDTTTGKAATPTIRAKATLALSAIKSGLLKKSAKPYVGKLYVSYMTVPPNLSRIHQLPEFHAQALVQAYSASP